MSLDPDELAAARARIASLPEELERVPEDQWPAARPGRSTAKAVWRSRRCILVLWEQPGDGSSVAADDAERWMRLSFQRPRVPGDPEPEPFTWDELMALKAEAGLDDVWAVEVYPPTRSVVNIAPMRHLFVTEKPPFAW